MRWCWLGSHEIPDGERMVIPPHDSSHICLPCSQTERGQRLMQDFNIAAGYQERDATTRYSRAMARWQRQGQRLKTR